MSIRLTTAAAAVVAASLPATAAVAAEVPAVPQMGSFDDRMRVPVGDRATDKILVSPEVSVLVLQRLDADREWRNVRQYRTKGRPAVTVKYPRARLGQQRFRVVPVSAEPPAFGVPGESAVIGYRPTAKLRGWTAGEFYSRKGTRQARVLQASPMGATAQLERRRANGTKWRMVHTAKIRDGGRLRLDPGPAVTGTTKYRVVIPRQDLVGKRLVSDVWTVVGYDRVPPTGMLPGLLNRLVGPLGIPQVSSSSVGNPYTARAACVAAELAGMGPSRGQPGNRLRARLLSTRSFTAAPAGMVNGINVSVRCQAAYFVRAGQVLRAVPVSTGQPGYRTNLGTYRIYRSVNGVETSNEFPDDHWNMYRSLYFNGGEAVHGSYSDSYVRTYPDSHGCVRMLHRDVDWLWRNGWTIGTTVRVYGSW